MGAPLLGPAPPRRRDQALAFIIERIARSGISPTLGEIAEALGISTVRARELVDQLVDAGLVRRRPGAQRNLTVVQVAECRNLLLESLRRMGWQDAEPMGEMRAPLPNVQLPLVPPFEHLPDVD